MEKVKVSREVATFIEDYEKSYMYEGWDNKMLSEHAYQHCSGSYLDESLKHISPLQLSKILIYGYEVEKTPEEKLFDNYNNHRRSAIKSPYSRGVSDGIVMALVRLGIEVKGITSK